MCVCPLGNLSGVTVLEGRSVFLHTLQNDVVLIMWCSPPRLVLSTPGATASSGGWPCVLGDLRTCKPVPDPKRLRQALLERGTLCHQPTHIS